MTAASFISLAVRYEILYDRMGYSSRASADSGGKTRTNVIPACRLQQLKGKFITRERWLHLGASGTERNTLSTVSCVLEKRMLLMLQLVGINLVSSST